MNFLIKEDIRVNILKVSSISEKNRCLIIDSQNKKKFYFEGQWSFAISRAEAKYKPKQRGIECQSKIQAHSVSISVRTSTDADR
ncbi:UNVERIFIED_CONTAM: hypothetical protein NCL1_03979 [Trichonephila clavipes]